MGDFGNNNKGEGLGGFFHNFFSNLGWPLWLLNFIRMFYLDNFCKRQVEEMAQLKQRLGY